MAIKTKNISQKLIASVFLSRKLYDDLRMFKYILNIKFGKVSDPINKILKYILDEGDIVLDVGANIGQSALHYCKYVGKSGEVFSFDPVIANYKQLVKLVKLLKLNNCTPINKAISNKNGVADILIPKINKNLIIGTQAVLEKSKKTSFDNFQIQIVETINLDSFAKENDISRVKLLKCDTEGAEIDVITGAIASIKKYTPIIILEISINNPKLAILYNLGYKPYHFINGRFIDAVNSKLIQDPIFIHTLKLGDINRKILSKTF